MFSRKVILSYCGPSTSRVRKNELKVMRVLAYLQMSKRMVGFKLVQSENHLRVGWDVGQLGRGVTTDSVLPELVKGSRWYCLYLGKQWFYLIDFKQMVRSIYDRLGQRFWKVKNVYVLGAESSRNPLRAQITTQNIPTFSVFKGRAGNETSQITNSTFLKCHCQTLNNIHYSCSNCILCSTIRTFEAVLIYN